MEPVERSGALAVPGSPSLAGEDLILERNIFIERILPGSVIRKLTDAEMDVYRRPFLTPGESRRPMLTWPRHIPFDGEPAEVTALVDAYSGWLSQSVVPKLFINAEPGAILIDGNAVPPELARSARGDGQGHPLHPGRFTARNRSGDCGLVSRALRK